MPKESYGFLYPVKQEDRTENGPNVTGTAILNGQEVRVAGWTKTAKTNGQRYLSLKFQGYEVTPAAAAPDADDDDLPF